MPGMRIHLIIFSLCALAAIAVPGILYLQSGPAPRVLVSSIIETPAAGEGLHAAVQFELDQMESLLEAAAVARPDADITATEPAGYDRPDRFEIAQSDASWSEIAEYEAVRDERHALDLATRSAPRTFLIAWPAIPGPAAFGASVRGSVGVLNPVLIGAVTRLDRTSVPRADRHGSVAGPAEDAISVLRLVYHSIRNGYGAGQGATTFIVKPVWHLSPAGDGPRNHLPASPCLLPAPGPVSNLSFPAFISFASPPPLHSCAKSLSDCFLPLTLSNADYFAYASGARELLALDTAFLISGDLI